MKEIESDLGIKAFIAITLFVANIGVLAETLTLESFQIDVKDGWRHSIESKPQNHDVVSDEISVSHLNGSGGLKMRAINTPEPISQERLRMLTNVDSSVPLSWKSWGDYSGYQHRYAEQGIFYRQWWLANEKGMILIVYSSDAEPDAEEIATVDEMVNSITAN